MSPLRVTDRVYRDFVKEYRTFSRDATEGLGVLSRFDRFRVRGLGV